ncbi:MAG: Eco57I restriction-modification methylase domain-containing protein [candidate division WOR-3 bacterium]
MIDKKLEGIIDNLIHHFSIENLRDFILYKDKEFKFSLKKITNGYEDERFKEIYQIGDTKLKDDTSFSVFIINHSGELTERTSKKKQFELAKKILRDFFYDAGFFIFYDKDKNFRFSLIHSIYKGTKREFSHYKRYTYYVEKGRPYRTFKKALYELEIKDLNSVLRAFAVKPLIKEFYTEIQNWYAWALKENVWFPGGNKEENLIRLLTRIIFVWFLRERKLIPQEIFDEGKLKDIVKDFGKKDYYYNVILQNLFFATLNRYPNERKFAEDKGYPANIKEFGVKNLFRYEKFLKISKKDFIEIFEKVPFINGGLFECLDEDKNYIDGFSRNENKRAKIPDYLFFSSEREEDLSHFYGEKRVTKVRGLINILKDYNFTADESSPIDVEVSLDPELLGHIFEHLLASYNPETRTTARKATGSYYTPKEIVDFMVEESLIEYLKANTSIDEEKLRKLFSYSEESVKITEEERDTLINIIDKIKIIDPAVGSGAFPMGIVHKLVYLLNKIDPENEKWQEIQFKRAIAEVENILKIKDKTKREELLKEINESFDEALTYPDYSRKLYIIQNSIYGVDIQNIAIQICKLRFFLSLLIDQKINPDKENYGIKPLPHLETNFVSADSLISLKASEQLSLEGENLSELKKELKKLYKKHFSIRTREEKKRIQEEASKIRQKIKELLIKNKWPNEEAEKIANFDIFDQKAVAKWFDPEWMFGIEDGFDIVIANPPYISTKMIPEDYKRILKEFYSFSDDTYNHFYFKGVELLKPNGILTYISSKTFWTIQTKKNLRELLLNNKILKLFDTANPFESSMVDTCIVILLKQKPIEDHIITFLDGKKDYTNPETYQVSQNIYSMTPNKVFFIPTSYNMKIYEKLIRVVNELLNKWWDKISTSKNIEKNKKILEEYRKNLKPGDITLLGLITEGGVGLQTGDNGKYIGVLEGTKWAEKVRKERPEKLLLASDFCKKEGIKTKGDAQRFLENLSEHEIRKLFDDLKEKYGRDIFGQGWLYRIVNKEEIADVNLLTDDEKLNGIKGEKTFVPYDKGDKEGNRWYAPTPYYIDWSRENVKSLQTDPKARWQGYQFFFREGFCWTNVSTPVKEESMFIKCRIKEKTINDVGSMSLFPIIINSYYYVCMLNSSFYFNFLKTFINTSVNLQLNDIRRLPIIIPTSDQLKQFESIFDRAYNIQKKKFEGKITVEEANQKLDEIQKELDLLVEEIYFEI